MANNTSRRRVLQTALATGGLALLGTRVAQANGLSPDEKKRIKEELLRGLERKVYAVDEALFRKVNRARDPKRYEGHETSHVPRITAPRKVRRLESFVVKIEVGVEEIHEMQIFHYVDWIGLRVDEVQINSTTMTPLFNRPIVSFELMLEKSASLFAQEHCNLHGLWESEPWKIQVVAGTTR